MRAVKPPFSPELKGKLLSSELAPTSEIVGDDQEDTRLLQKMADEAERYIKSFSWCRAVLDSYFGGGVGGIFAIFFFHILPSRSEVDPWIWIVVGDIPSSYLPVSDCDSPKQVFRTYMNGMRRWVEFARNGKNGTAEQGVPPVDVPATPQWAESLNDRLQNLEFLIGPFFEDDGGHSVS